MPARLVIDSTYGGVQITVDRRSAWTTTLQWPAVCMAGKAPSKCCHPAPSVGHPATGALHAATREMDRSCAGMPPRQTACYHV